MTCTNSLCCPYQSKKNDFSFRRKIEQLRFSVGREKNLRELRMQMADGKLQSDCTLESPAYRVMNTRSKMSGEGGSRDLHKFSLLPVSK